MKNIGLFKIINLLCVSINNMCAQSLSTVQFSAVAQSCLTLCHLIGCSMPGFPVHPQLLELAPTHVHKVGDAIQTSHPLLSPSLPAFNLFYYQGLFQ